MKDIVLHFYLLQNIDFTLQKIFMKRNSYFEQ